MNKTLARVGPQRGGIRVFEDAKRQMVRVQWREHGRPRFQSFPLTAAGRQEAKAYARGVWARRSEPDAPPTPTVRELWALYAEAEFPSKRLRTQILYRARWKLFEVFVGHDTDAGTIGQLTMGQFAAALRKQDYAPNQVGAHVRMVKIVFGWAKRTKVLRATDVGDYRFKLAKEERRQPIPEYRLPDFEQMMATLNPQAATQWRAAAVLLFLGSQGVRENAALHLRWTDIRDGWIHWHPDFDKAGRRDFTQPLRDGARAALLTARDWRTREGYEGQWVFPSARQGRRANDLPWTAQALARMLWEAEKKAGVPHLELRGAHGLRRMVAGEIAQLTGDPWLALQFIGDTDPDLIPTYIKVRPDRLQFAADLLDNRPLTGHSEPEKPKAPRLSRSGAFGSREPPVGLEPTTAGTDSPVQVSDSSGKHPRVEEEHPAASPKRVRNRSGSGHGAATRGAPRKDGTA